MNDGFVRDDDDRLEIVHEIATLLGVQLTPQQLAIVDQLCAGGMNPDVVAEIVADLQSQQEVNRQQRLADARGEHALASQHDVAADAAFAADDDDDDARSAVPLDNNTWNGTM